MFNIQGDFWELIFFFLLLLMGEKSNNLLILTEKLKKSISDRFQPSFHMKMSISTPMHVQRTQYELLRQKHL